MHLDIQFSECPDSDVTRMRTHYSVLIPVNVSSAGTNCFQPILIQHPHEPLDGLVHVPVIPGRLELPALLRHHQASQEAVDGSAGGAFGSAINFAGKVIGPWFFVPLRNALRAIGFLSLPVLGQLLSDRPAHAHQGGLFAGLTPHVSGDPQRLE